MQEKIEELKNEKRLLIADLTAPNSAVGDWKVIKNIEYQMAGLEPKYDPYELHAERDRIRQRINEIDDEILSLDIQL